MTELPGENRGNPITSFDLRLTYDDKGNVTHVQNRNEPNSHPVPLVDWNKRYENKSPQARGK